jgi:predicted 3-demethylubiquinone-9 3-methyltransferase (glyoxalase superfamily)
MPAFENFPKITPFLWFDTNAEEAANYYITIFPNARILDVFRTDGKVLTVSFELEGLKFTALNAGPHFKFNEAVSFVIRCESQEEIDHYWAKLTDGGKEIECGWCKDKFGLVWQVIPANIGKLISTPKGMQAMMKMTKFNIAELERAARE